MRLYFVIFGLALFFTVSGFAACEGTLQTFSMNDPIDQKQFAITAKVYRPSPVAGAKISTVFVLPPIIGETRIDRMMAQKLCGSGIATYILNVVKDMTIEEEISYFQSHDDTYVRALAGVQTVIKELKKDSEINGKFGILGMSLGGMISAYVAGSEPQILASVIVVGGGNVAGIISYSDQERVAAIREGRMAKFNIKDEASYEAMFKGLIPHDPLSVAHLVAPGSMYMFIAVNDSTVPTVYQNELRDAVAEPLVYEMRANHVNGIIKAGTVHAGKITNFFSSKL